MSQDFEVFRLKPRAVQAVRYALDGSNAKLLTQHSLIQGVPDTMDLCLVNQSDDSGHGIVHPGDWIVKVDGDFQKYPDDQFHHMFEQVRAGIGCIFCAEKFKNIEELKKHSLVCVDHPANKKSEGGV